MCEIQVLDFRGSGIYLKYRYPIQIPCLAHRKHSPRKDLICLNAKFVLMVGLCDWSLNLPSMYSGEGKSLHVIAVVIGYHR